MKAFAASDTGYLPLLANILWERGKVFVIIAILSLTALKAILPLLLRCLIYFTGGVFFAACVMNMGILGIVFFWYRGCRMEFCILQRLRFYCW